LTTDKLRLTGQRRQTDRAPTTRCPQVKAHRRVRKFAVKVEKGTIGVQKSTIGVEKGTLDVQNGTIGVKKSTIGV
jgi:hypothetical protein